MPKATLTFILPEEQEEYQLAINGINYCIAVSDFMEWIRQQQKYNNVETMSLTDVKAKLLECLQERGIFDGV